jgi:hypothetical protein
MHDGNRCTLQQGQTPLSNQLKLNAFLALDFEPLRTPVRFGTIPAIASVKSHSLMSTLDIRRDLAHRTL